MAINKSRRRIRVISEIFRIVVAVTFIFSGFVKAADPWGTAIKFGEYFTAFGMEWLEPLKFALSILLSGTELLLGLLMLLRVWLRGSSLGVFIFMASFTVLTFVLALTDPVDDCGCFGDAVKLTNWETFFKNLLLLPMSYLVMRVCCRDSFKPDRRAVICIVLMATISYGTGIYAYRHLPLIDFLPYKVGIDLRAEYLKQGSASLSGGTTLVYRDRLSGEIREFSTEDTQWHDAQRWEYVRTRTRRPATRVTASVRDFAVYGIEGSQTQQLLDSETPVYMVFVHAPGNIARSCEQRLGVMADVARRDNARVICITPAPVAIYPHVRFAGRQVECYNMDATTMKTILRAQTGVVVLANGVIEAKLNCRDIPRDGKITLTR